ncbi:NAD-dependent epimerase/dehydratase family protein, partial [Campylobacter jejuni]|uniref:NAD-dependent epimerase/dehydratase family protein n=1 Tax=Campylobacter jejuni TaxID=197 RepID=UPI00131A055E
ESEQNPLNYYINNTDNTTILIEAGTQTGVNKVILSSTATPYGGPQTPVVSETSPIAPINPYGRSKLMSEKVLRDGSIANPEFKHCLLSNFNGAGACKDYTLGQRYAKATLLIKVAAEWAAGKRDKLFIFGDDYDTKDGTCIRDFIHVDDIS